MEDTAVIVLDDDIAPGAYAYLLVNNGHGTMATVIYRNYRMGEVYFEKMVRFFNSNVEKRAGAHARNLSDKQVPVRKVQSCGLQISGEKV